MESYKYSDKIRIGASDIAALTVTGLSDGDLVASILNFGEDGAYSAYLCYGEVEIGSHYRLVRRGSHWLRIYDDDGVAYYHYGDEFKFWDIYRSGEFGCIIHWHN